MRDFLILCVHVIVTLARLARPGGLRSVVAESVLVRHQLLVLNRGRKRAPSLRAADRIIAGLCTLFMHPARVLRSAIVLKPSTLLHLHGLLKTKVPKDSLGSCDLFRCESDRRASDISQPGSNANGHGSNAAEETSAFR